MTAYFSQLLAQTGLPPAANGASPGGEAAPTPRFNGQGGPGLTGLEPGEGDPAGLLPEIESVRELPSETQPQAAPPTGLPEVQTQVGNLLPPGPAAGPEPGARPDAERGPRPEPLERAEVRAAASDVGAPRPQADERGLPAAWLRAFQQARDWVSAGPQETQPPVERLEIEGQEFSQRAPASGGLAAERPPAPEPPAGAPPAETGPGERFIKEETLIHTAGPAPREAYAFDEQRHRGPDDFGRPAHAEQHQELNLTIGSIVVTVEGPPLPPAPPPAFQAARPAADPARGSRRGEAGGRLSRHYLRLR